MTPRMTPSSTTHEPTRALAHVSGLDLAPFRPDHVAERIRRALDREGVASVEALVRLLGSRSGRESAVPPLRRRPGLRPVPRPAAVRPSRARGAAAARELRRTDSRLVRGLRGRLRALLAMLLERRSALGGARLLGSDLLGENIEAAARGVYGDVAVPDALRARVRFERRDIVRAGAPPGAWHVVLCRNVAIYLEPSARRRLHATLADALACGGTLLLGRSARSRSRASPVPARRFVSTCRSWRRSPRRAREPVDRSFSPPRTRDACPPERGRRGTLNRGWTPRASVPMTDA